MGTFELRIAVSNSHVHLSAEHARALFGLTELPVAAGRGHPKFLPTTLVLRLVGPKGTLEGIRVLSPCTQQTWVELNLTHARVLGVRPPLEEGPLQGGSLRLHGPVGSVEVTTNVVIEARHLEITAGQAVQLGLKHGQVVEAETTGPRAVRFRNVKVRVVESSRGDFDGVLELDRDEANAAMVEPGARAVILAAD